MRLEEVMATLATGGSVDVSRLGGTTYSPPDVGGSGNTPGTHGQAQKKVSLG